MTGSGRRDRQQRRSVDLGQLSPGERGLPPEPPCNLGRSLGGDDLLCKSKAPTVAFCSVGVGVFAHA